MGPNLGRPTFQNQNTYWTWDPTLQYLHSKLKHTLDMGPNLAILTFQTKTHTRLGTQQNAMLTFQTKTHTKPKTQPCITYIPKLKHTLDMGPITIIPIFRTNNCIYNQTFVDSIIFSHNQENVSYIHTLIHYMKLIEL